MRSALVRYALYQSIAIILLVSTSSICAIGQSSIDGRTPTGLESGTVNSYSLGDIDHINPATSSLSISLPLLRIGGRGRAGYTMTMPVESHWYLQVIPNQFNEIDGLDWYTEYYDIARRLPGPGILALIKRKQTLQSCSNFPPYSETISKFTFTWPDGAETVLVDSVTNGSSHTNNSCTTGDFSRGNIWYAIDGSGISFISDQPVLEGHFSPINTSRAGNLMLKDGTLYRINDSGRVEYIRDRNGNKCIFQYDTGGKLIYARDPVGRETSITYSPTQAIIHYKGFAGASRTITIDWADQVPSSEWLRPGLPGPYTHTQAFTYYGIHTPDSRQIKPFGPSKVTLSDGRFYRFWYNAYAEVARVDLPTGGRFEYDWGAGYGAQSDGSQGFPLGPFRVVKERRAYLNTTDTDPIERMLINRAGRTQPTVIQHVVPGTNPPVALQTTKHYFTGDPSGSLYVYVGFEYANPLDNKEYKTEYFEGSTLNRSTEHHWENSLTGPQLRWQRTTLNDVGLVSLAEYDYDNYQNVIETREFDYGVGAPGPLLRRTQTIYLTNNPNQGDVNYATDFNIHIRNLPLQQQVFDAGGIKRAETIYEYDNYDPDTFHAALGDCQNIIGHDGAFSTGYLTRGNLTRTSRLLLNNEGATTGSINSYAQYNIAGNAVKVIDGRTPAGITTFEFLDRFGPPGDDARSNAVPPELTGVLSYAFPTKVTNALDHTAYTKYDYYLGKPVAVEDANGVVSSVEYNDVLGRPTRSIQAGYVVGVGVPTVKKQTTTTYDDTNHVITMTSDRDASNILTAKSYYDGLGRTWRTAAYEGSTWSITDTQFDALGRVSQVSNPYRATDPKSASAPSGLWTETIYDSLGRVVDVETPDGAHDITQYTGNQVMVIDQAGKRRWSETDALGRLIKITEDPGGSNLDTYYFYDALGNLRQVNQGSQTRTFDYDSLSRLTSATNPESGRVEYNYDPNGNLVEKTDARGVKTTMIYDALNRISSKSYTGLNSEGTAVANVTPQVKYFYDDYLTLPSGAPSWAGTPSKGGLTGITYGSGSEGTYYSYDAAGRIATNIQRQGTANYATIYTYNLAGGVELERRGRYSNNQFSGEYLRNRWGYDDAGRIIAMEKSITPFQSFTYLATNISYTPSGALQSETYGNGLIHSIGYNERLQPTEIRLGRPDNLESVFTIYSMYGTANNGEVQDAEINLAQNNGNIARIRYSVSGTIQYTQTFLYDALNRLGYAVEHNNGTYNEAARAWYQTFVYDRYGNRGINVLNTSDNADALNTALQFSDFSGVNNRITRDGYAYDAAGNLTAEPGKSYTYDAENRLVTATVGGVLASQYYYDGNGRRVKQIVGGAATRFEYGAGGELIAERNDATGAVTKAYCYKGGQLIATTPNGGSYVYATADHLGSPRAWTDGSGNLVAGGRHDYLPFGEELLAGIGTRTSGQGYANNGQQDGQRKQFGSYERDTETGLDFAEARYFASIQGRFTSPDDFFNDSHPADPQSWNLYAYVRNNPLNVVDPTGRFSTHTDDDGNVIAVYNDGDLGVYRHSDTNLLGWDGKRKLSTSVGPGVELIGGTLHWDEFAYLDKNGNPVEGAQSDETRRGRILFDESWEEIMKQIHNQQIQLSPDEVANMSRNGKQFDIKTRGDFAQHGHFTGREVSLLSKQYRHMYMSAKSVGNFMVGHYAGFMGVPLHTIMNLAGSLQQKQWQGGTTMAEILAGKEFGPAPYYGETIYAGRNIKLGHAYGVMRKGLGGKW